MKNIFLLIFSIVLLVTNSNAASLWPNGQFLETFQKGFIFGNKLELDFSGAIPKWKDGNGVLLPLDKPVEKSSLINAGFEEGFTGSEALGWTNVAGTLSLVADTKMGGSKALNVALAAQTLDLSQGFNCNDYDKNTVGFNTWIKTDVLGPEVCSYSGVNEIECKALNEVNKWFKVQIIMPVKTGENCTIKFKTNGNVTGNVTIADVEFSSSPLKIKSFLENEFTARIDNNGTTASVVSENTPFIQSVTRDGLGAVTINFKTGFFTQTPSVQVKVGPQNTEVSVERVQVLTSNSIQVITQNTTNGSIDVPFSIHVSRQGSDYRKKDEIITASDIVSSETMSFLFKSTAITDADPIGTYNTYSYAINTNATSICGTAPTTLPNNIDGLKMFARAATVASDCGANISRFEIKIGKNLKGISDFGYQSANKGGNSLDTDFSPVSGEGVFGLLTSYNSRTGILSIDSGQNYSATSGIRQFVDGQNNRYNVGYFHFHASKNPVVNAISITGFDTCIFKDEKAQGTNAQTLPNNAWATRDLTIGGCSFASLSINQITLNEKGRYIVEWSTPVVAGGVGSSRLINSVTTTIKTDVDGNNCTGSATEATASNVVTSLGGCVVDLSAGEKIAIQQYINTGPTTQLALNLAGQKEVYSILKIKKIK